MNRQPPRIARYALFVALSAFGVFTIIGSNHVPPNPSPPAPVVGAISVTVGFGAVTSTPYLCMGQETITINPKNLTGTGGKDQSETKILSYSGFSSTQPATGNVPGGGGGGGGGGGQSGSDPACQTSMVFSGLKIGSWEVTNGSVSCLVTLNPSLSIAEVRIRNTVALDKCQ